MTTVSDSPSARVTPPVSAPPGPVSVHAYVRVSPLLSTGLRIVIDADPVPGTTSSLQVWSTPMISGGSGSTTTAEAGVAVATMMPTPSAVMRPALAGNLVIPPR